MTPSPEQRKKLCDCGFPQSSPIPHDHSRPEQRFTDEQIRRLKENYDPSFHPISPAGMKALLARLEAVERWAWAQDPANGPIDKEFIKTSKEACRQVSGK